MDGELVRATAARLNIAVDEVFVDHHERAVFRSGDAVVKVDRREEQQRAELVALRAAGAAGLPVPRVLNVDDGLPTVMVIEHRGGTPLGSMDDRRAWQAAGEVLRALHDVPIPDDLPRFDFREPNWRSFALWWIDHYRGEAPLRADIVERLHARVTDTFTAMPEPRRVFLHGDCAPAHFLVDEATNEITGLIDFGDTGSGDPAYDIAVLTLWPTERLEPVLAGYKPAYDVSADVLDAYRIVRHLGAADWLMEHGFDPSWDLIQVASYARP
jgi:aminoglycoside phosphotransferase (APT) family kinase protein